MIFPALGFVHSLCDQRNHRCHNCDILLAEARSEYAGSAKINGIAYDSLANKIFVTRKPWPVIFEITFSH